MNEVSTIFDTIKIDTRELGLVITLRKTIGFKEKKSCLHD